MKGSSGQGPPLTSGDTPPILCRALLTASHALALPRSLRRPWGRERGGGEGWGRERDGGEEGVRGGGGGGRDVGENGGDNGDT